MTNREIYIYHRDWEGTCILEDNNKIFRQNIESEIGQYTIINNKLLIKWDKWNEEEFFYFNNSTQYYLKELFDNNYSTVYILYKDNIEQMILDKNNNIFVLYNKDIITGEYIKDNNLIITHQHINENIDKTNNIKVIFKNILNNIYCLYDDYFKNIFFDLKIVNNSINELYIFNKITKTFYNNINIDNRGVYDIIDNCIYMNWDNGYTKKFYSNKYSCHDKINKNINIIKPTNVIINNRVLFSNISLCKKNIVMTSMHFKTNKWDFDLLEINISECNIINKTILDNNDEYEGSTVILLELDTFVNNLFLNITYNNKYKYNLYLEQLNINEHKISATTLFKDDYPLLKRYLKYYGNLGIEVFYIYYNKKIDYLIVEEIIKLNENNYMIYLIEWDYLYWWKDKEDIKKYHHAQIMSINDSLNILRNYGHYTLYNDLDEYIEYENIFTDFNKLIEDNKMIDVFIFKNRFCKMGNDIIKYKDFDAKFNLNNIIQGNYYDMYREKNIIKLNSVRIMGVHKYFKKFNIKELEEMNVSQFFHFINYEEKHREHLMTEYVY